MEIVDNPKEKWNQICSRLTSSYKQNEEIVSKFLKTLKKMVTGRTKFTLKYDNVSIKDFLVSGKYQIL